MIMSSPLKERAAVDIRATAEAHNDIADDLPANHGLSGADTVASLHGIGKATVIKVSKTGRFSLSKVGDVTADMKSVSVSYSPFIVTMAVSVAVCEIFSVKEWRDLENQVRGRSRSMKTARFDRHMRLSIGRPL